MKRQKTAKANRPKVEFIPAQRAIHERSRRERPGPDELLARGDLEELVPNWQAVELELLMKALRAERERRGLSLNAVAEQAGVTKSMISELENGRRLNPTLATLYRYALAVGMHIQLVPIDPAEAWNKRG
jgi:DNA-binding XRE family transcriptional regulator